MTAEEVLQKLHQYAWTGCEPGLERVRALLFALGEPQKALKFVHIAGSNGKGSSSAMLASVLRAAGYRTGLFTSPHLVRMNERMQVDGVEITDAELSELAELVLDRCRGLAEIKFPEGSFEIGSGSFIDCISLEDIDLGAASVGDFAFEGCERLKRVCFSSQANLWGDGIFDGCELLR